MQMTWESKYLHNPFNKKFCLEKAIPSDRKADMSAYEAIVENFHL